jgi:hypothetical protein
LVERNAWGQQTHCVAEFQKFDGKSKADACKGIINNNAAAIKRVQLADAHRLLLPSQGWCYRWG